MGEISNALKAFDNVDNFSDEQINEINELNGEFKNLAKQADALQATIDIQAQASASTRVAAPVAPVVNQVPAGQGARTSNHYDKTMGFKNFGEFAGAVADISKGKIHNNFNNSTAYELAGEDGGVLIPTDFMSDIREKVTSDESLLPRTSNFTTSSNHMSVPTDEKEPWNGGITASWLGEGQQYTASKQELGQANFRLHKLGALVKCTDELLEDASALESYIRRKAPSAIVHKLNDAIIAGDGSAKPSGIINSGFTFEVAKEGGQTADTIVYNNIIKMEARLLPQSAGRAVWLAHPQVKEQLRQLQDSNGNLIYMNGGQFANAAAPGFDTLLGKPVVYMMGSMPQLGNSGDLILADLDYYYSVLKTSAITQDVSTHLFFDRDITAFKFTMRVDGKCPFKAPVTTQNGSFDMSGFVKLAERA